jgi:hypothetical protein
VFALRERRFLTKVRMKRFFLIIIFFGLGCALFAKGKAEAPPEQAAPPPAPPAEEQYSEEYPAEQETYVPPVDQPVNGNRTLAVLPFTGVTTGDGEALALLFSNNLKLRESYDVVPLTRNSQQRVRNEQQSASGAGNQITIDFVMAGIVRNIRNNNVLLVNVVERGTRQLVAGDFRIYNDPSELQTLIPAMIEYMIQSAQKPRNNLPKLAITPFDTPQPGVSAGEAEMLALLLSAEVASSGQDAVLPRMDPLLQALDQIAQINPGMAYDTAQGSAELVLTGSVITLGTKNLFIAQIERISDGVLEHCAEESYETSSDGILQVIPRLSQALTGIASSRAIPPPGNPITGQPASQSPSSPQQQQPYVPTGGDYRPTVVVPQGNQPSGSTTNGGAGNYPPSSTNTYTPPAAGGSSSSYFNPLAPR